MAGNLFSGNTYRFKWWKSKENLFNLKAQAEADTNAAAQTERKVLAKVPHTQKALAAMTPENRARARAQNAVAKARNISHAQHNLEKHINMTTRPDGTRDQTHLDTHVVFHAARPHPDILMPAQYATATAEQYAKHLKASIADLSAPATLEAQARAKRIKRNTKRQLARIAKVQTNQLASSLHSESYQHCIFAPTETIQIRGRIHRRIDLNFNTSTIPQIQAIRAELSSKQRIAAKLLPPTCNNRLCTNPLHHPAAQPTPTTPVLPSLRPLSLRPVPVQTTNPTQTNAAPTNRTNQSVTEYLASKEFEDALHELKTYDNPQKTFLDMFMLETRPPSLKRTIDNT